MMSPARMGSEWWWWVGLELELELDSVKAGQPAMAGWLESDHASCGGSCNLGTLGRGAGQGACAGGSPVNCLCWSGGFLPSEDMMEVLSTFYLVLVGCFGSRGVS